jgi:thiamine-phosphate pyrophosphorylase
VSAGSTRIPSPLAGEGGRRSRPDEGSRREGSPAPNDQPLTPDPSPARGEGKASLDPFYPIVDSAAWVARLTGAGARLVQLRVKDKDEKQVARETRKALALCAAAGAVLVVNDYWRIAIDEGAPWVHLGQGDLDRADIAAIRRAGVRLGVSTHDEAELQRALALDPDYVALGPIYPTILKAMAFAPQGLDRIGEWKRSVGAVPLVAIGGLNVERAKLCLAAGADIVSVVTDVTLNADPEARAREWIAATHAA